MSTEFQLATLFPFFATFVDALGFEVRVAAGGDRNALKRGIEGANVSLTSWSQVDVDVSDLLVKTGGEITTDPDAEWTGIDAFTELRWITLSTEPGHYPI